MLESRRPQRSSWPSQQTLQAVARNGHILNILEVTSRVATLMSEVGCRWATSISRDYGDTESGARLPQWKQKPGAGGPLFT